MCSFIRHVCEVSHECRFRMIGELDTSESNRRWFACTRTRL